MAKKTLLFFGRIDEGDSMARLSESSDYPIFMMIFFHFFKNSILICVHVRVKEFNKKKNY